MKMTVTAFVGIFLVLLLGAAPALADATSKEDAAAVELGAKTVAALSRTTNLELLSHDMGKVSYASCLPCHGAEGQGERSVFAPSLAGQRRWYLERQLKNFQEGVRGVHPDDVHGAAMRAMALLLKDDAVRERVLDEIEALPVQPPEALTNVTYDLKSGEERYTLSCARCHGDHAEGDKSQGAPRLNALPAWYTARQLRNFQLGIRGEHEGDHFGEEMRPMAMVVFKENELLDVAAYIATLYEVSAKNDPEETD